MVLGMENASHINITVTRRNPHEERFLFSVGASGVNGAGANGASGMNMVVRGSSFRNIL